MSYRPERPGTVKHWSSSTAPTGWLFLCEKTIGSATSGATALAHAKTQALFTRLWTDFSNTELHIQDSSGTPTTRGGSAAADFAANKRMPLPDGRGRSLAGKDDQGGSAANRLTGAGSGITGSTIGTSGGEETHLLSGSESGTPVHSHSITDPGHQHNNQSGGSAGQIPAGAFLCIQSSQTETKNNLVQAEFTGITGTNNASAANASSAHQNVQPTLVLPSIIKL